MIPTMEKQPLRLGVFKLRRLNNLTLPWPTRKQPEDTGKKVIEIKTKKALSTLWPLDELEAPLKKKLNFDYIEESFNELLQCSRGIRKNSSRRLSSTFSQIPQASLAPITPHTKKTRRKRAAKKNVAPPTRRSTRTTRTSKVHLSNISILPEIQENSSNVSENEDFTTPLKEPMKKRKMVKMTIPEPEPKTPVQINEIHSSTPDQISEHVGENNVQMVTPEPVHRNEAELEELNETPEAMEGVTESGIEHENNIDDTPTEVKNLISLHETLIKNSTKTGNLKRTSDNADEDKNHSSPVLKLTADTNESNKRSMEDQVKSCVKKKPIVNIARLKLLEVSPMIYSDSPQKPITLTFDASDDEDIADNNTEMNENNSIEPVGLLKPPTMSGLTGTPCSTVPANNPVPSRRSLNFHLQLSGAESDLENSISTDHCDRVEAQPQTSGTIEQDSLEAVDGEEVHNDTNATTSMASSSVCSSSAATVVFDSEDYSSVSQEDSCSEVEEKTPVVARRSTRCSKRKSIVTGLASKRLSVTAKLAAKRHDADEKAFEKSLVMTNDDDNEDSSDEEKIKKKPKIVKPVRKPPRTVLKSTSRLPVSCSSNRVVSETKKRTLDEVEMRGPMSPCPQPKQKKTRNTFLNRSTAASRARRTPNKTPTMGSRTRAALIAGSPFKFTSQSVCLSPVPRPANLTCEVQSFIRRNTPQKINYEDLMAAKKQQLEEKEKREKELKRKKMEEKQKKIEQKRRQRSARLRKVAEQREEKARIEKEKQQKQIEQWEKRIVNADKVKILRKNEEVAKSKKVQKKQAEAEELRKREEEERIRRVKEQEQETDQRLHEQKLLREQEAALKKQVEQERIMEKKRQDKIREEKEAAEEMKRMEEDKMKREEEEKTKRKKADDALKLKQQKIEKEELERKRKMQDEIDKRNAEASRLEQERIEKEKESQRKIQEDVKRRQEEAVRRKEKEEARKRKLEEAKAVAEEKAMRRKQEELARTEELRHKREEIRRQAEKRREEERQQREEEKKKLDEEKMRLQEIAKQEKLRKIQESNEKIRQLEAAHKQERERRRLMDESLCQTPGNNPNSTYNVDTSTLHASPQSYDMTPQVIKVFAQSTEDNYNIDDIASDDETDDDEDPRKVVPKWAKGANLRSQLIKQYYTPPNMLLIFCDALPAEGVRLDKIFTKAPKPRYYNRTSSAHWTSPIMPPGHISFTDQCRGFEE